MPDVPGNIFTVQVQRSKLDDSSWALLNRGCSPLRIISGVTGFQRLDDVFEGEVLLRT